MSRVYTYLTLELVSRIDFCAPLYDANNNALCYVSYILFITFYYSIQKHFSVVTIKKYFLLRFFHVDTYLSLLLYTT